MNKSYSEIYEGWSERDVNLMLFFLQGQSLANETDDQKFYRRIAELVREEMSTSA